MAVSHFHIALHRQGGMELVKRKFLLMVSLTILVISVGVILGLTLALFTADTGATKCSFTAQRISIVSWRGKKDAVPPGSGTHREGWPAPMFYTTREEGAYPTAPEGKCPTGPWAPGDSIERTLSVRNVEVGVEVRLEAVSALLYGDTELAPYFTATVRSSRSKVIYQGTLEELAAGPQPFIGETGPGYYLLMSGLGQQQLLFEVTLSPDVPNDFQGKTLKADFLVYAGQHRNRP